MDNKTDLRIIKTRNSLYDALIFLLKDKTFEKIKVSDICKTALINRSTFYSHFDDKYELFKSFIEDLKISFSNELKTIEENVTIKQYYMQMIKIFLNYIEGKEDIYKSIMINNKNSIIMDMLYDTIMEDINNKISHSINDIPSDIVSSFYLGAVINVGIDWLKNGKNYSKEEILKYLDKLIK